VVFGPTQSNLNPVVIGGGHIYEQGRPLSGVENHRIHVAVVIQVIKCRAATPLDDLAAIAG
jgi:hypothetical protein